MLKRKGAGKILLTTALAGSATGSAVTQSTSTSAHIFNIFSNREIAMKKEIDDRNLPFNSIGIIFGMLVGTIFASNFEDDPIDAIIKSTESKSLSKTLMLKVFVKFLTFILTSFAPVAIFGFLGKIFTWYAVAENKFTGFWKNEWFLGEKSLSCFKIEDELNDKFSITVEKAVDDKNESQVKKSEKVSNKEEKSNNNKEASYCLVIKGKGNSKEIKHINFEKNYNGELGSKNFAFRINLDEEDSDKIGDIEIVDKNNNKVAATCERDILNESKTYSDIKRQISE